MRLRLAGNVSITINGAIWSGPAASLLQTLAAQKLFVPSACGGERHLLHAASRAFPAAARSCRPASAARAACGDRLSCQVAVKRDMEIGVPKSGVMGMYRRLRQCLPLSRPWFYKLPRART